MDAADPLPEGLPAADLIRSASGQRRHRPARPSPPTSPLAAQLAAWVQARGPGIQPVTALRAVHIWSWVHGFVSLEIAGNFASIGIDDPGEIFQTQLAALGT